MPLALTFVFGNLNENETGAAVCLGSPRPVEVSLWTVSLYSTLAFEKDRMSRLSERESK